MHNDVTRTCRGIWLIGAALMSAALAGPAHAQLLDRYSPANIPAYQDWFAGFDALSGDSVYQGVGVRVDSFIVHPSIHEAIGFDSDPAGAASPRSSTVLQSGGVVAVDSDWSRNAVDASIAVDDTRYFNLPQQSYTNWTASAGSTVEYGDDEIHLGYRHSNTVTLPTDVGNFSLQAPVIGKVEDFRASDTIGPGPLTLEPQLVGQLYRFSGTGGEEAVLDLFNRNAFTGSLTAGYQFAGGHNLLVILSDSTVTYAGGVQRPPDYNDFSVLTGIEYRQSALIVYRALVGFEERFLAANHVGSTHLSSPGAELDVIWTPTRLVSITGRVSEGLQDEPTSTGQGVTQTTAQLTLNYALRRNVTIETSGQFDRVAFPGNGDAVQTDFTAAVEARWFPARNWSLSLRYAFSQSEAAGDAGSGFTRNAILMRATFGL